MRLQGEAIVIHERIPYIPMPMDEYRREQKELGEGAVEPDIPEGVIPFWMQQHEIAPAVHVKDGRLAAKPAPSVYGGEIDDEKAVDLRIVSYDGNVGGVYAEGADTDYTLEGAVISLSGTGPGIGISSAGVTAANQARLTLKECLVDTWGVTRISAFATDGGILKVHDSVITSHGGPFGEDAPEGSDQSRSAPPMLDIQGNNRTHCTTRFAYSYYYNSLITCDGWAALSTDDTHGYAYLEANDCRIVTTKSGYGTYADWGCHTVMNRCRFNVACMAAIIGGEASIRFTDCDFKCGTYLSMIHCVLGRHTEVAELTLTGCQARTGTHAIEVRSHNAVVTLRKCDIHPGGALLRTIKNPDINSAIVHGRPVFGVELHLEDMSVTGDILHEDPERDCRVYLASACLYGTVSNAVMMLDPGSRWYASGDSYVTFGCDFDTDQVDAPAGVTIHAQSAERADTYTLQSGGTLVFERRS